MIKFIRRMFFYTRKALFGTIYKKGGIRVDVNGWVTIGDGKTKDMLPITMVSQELVDMVEKYLEDIGLEGDEEENGS